MDDPLLMQYLIRLELLPSILVWQTLLSMVPVKKLLTIVEQIFLYLPNLLENGQASLALSPRSPRVLLSIIVIVLYHDEARLLRVLQ
jgi:hypothetical protein